MNTEELFEKKKESHIKAHTNIAKSLFVSNLFFAFAWVITGLKITDDFFLDSDDEPIIVYIFIAFWLMFLIYAIVKKIITNNNETKKINYFSKEEKETYLKKYIIIQIAYTNIIFVGIIIVLIGLVIRQSLGIQIASLGIAITGIGISICIYNKVIRQMYLSKKSNVVNDVIKEKGLYHSTSIFDRLIILILFIVVAIMLYALLTDYNNALKKVLLFVTYIILMAYFTYIQIKCYKKLKD